MNVLINVNNLEYNLKGSFLFTLRMMCYCYVLYFLLVCLIVTSNIFFLVQKVFSMKNYFSSLFLLFTSLRGNNNAFIINKKWAFLSWNLCPTFPFYLSLTIDHKSNSKSAVTWLKYCQYGVKNLSKQPIKNSSDFYIHAYSL